METWRETCKEPTFLLENKTECQFWINRNGGINPKRRIIRNGGAALKWLGGQ
jgi:hypothetical protein